jgi:cholesterol oxidase
MVASMEITGERRRLARWQLLLRFGWTFVDAVIQARVWLLRRTEVVDPFSRPPEPSLERLTVGLTIYDDETPPRFVLTEFTHATQRATKGPVIVAPGFGMSTYAFRMGKKSFTEFLCEQGYSVWLFDYRSSDRLDASADQFTIDDLALRDFPDAIARVYAASGNQPVRLVMHCVASVTTLMSILSGALTPTHVRSAVLSQYFAFVEQPWINRFKAALRLPELLKWMNFRPVMTPGYDAESTRRAHWLDTLLRVYPTRERCSSGVCRRLLLMYGEVIRHDRIDRQTHDRMYDMFGRANLTFFEQMTRMVRRHRAVDYGGADSYLTTGNAKRLTIPLTLVQGTANGLFLPKGGGEMFDWLVANGPHPDNRRWFSLLRLPGVGHLDTFLAPDAEGTAFVPIAEALERMDQIPRRG